VQGNSEKKGQDMEAAHAVMMTDDVKCIKLLTDLGLLEVLRPKPPHNQASHAFDKGYWCLAICDFDPDRGDNGYTVCGLPKSEFSKEEAEEFFSDLLRQTSANGIFESVDAQATTLKDN
jgi:hypothetical protein